MKRSFKRAIHFDFHTLAGIDGLLQDFDAADFAKTLAEANVGYINFTAMCNNGYCYYPTHVGTVYPGLKRDILGEVLEACHRYGIGVTAYLNVGINFEAAKNHIEWCRIDETGRVLVTYSNLVHDIDRRDGNLFTRTMCFNHPGYVTHTLELIREIAQYDVDGIFCDGFYPEVCYCPVCMQKMLDAGVDVSAKEAVYHYQDLTTRRFSQQIREVLGTERYAFFNGIAPEFLTNAHAEIEALPSWIWIHYDSFPQRAAYLRGLYNTRVYMTGRFQRDWGDFGGIRPRAALENDLYDAFMNSYELSFGDHLHPVSGINKSLYKVIGDVFAQAKLYEPYADGAQYAADIAVLCENYEDLLDTRNRGASRMLSELKYTYDFINPDMFFGKYKLIIIPDRIPMTESLQKKLDQYIDQGGKLLTTGTAGLKPDCSGFALKDYHTITVDGLDPVKTAYFKLRTDLPAYPQTIWSIYYSKRSDDSIGGQQILMRNNGGNVFADLVPAYFGEIPNGIHGCCYRPPMEPVEHAAAVQNANSAHICFDIFENYGVFFLQAHRELVRQLIESLLPTPLLKTDDLPSTSKLSLTSKAEYDLLHVKVTYPEHRNFRAIIEEHNILEPGKTVQVRGTYRSAHTLPSLAPLELTQENGYTTVTLPRIVGYQMIRLSK